MADRREQQRLAEALLPLLVAQSGTRRGTTRRQAHRALLAALGDQPDGALVRRLAADPDPRVRALLADATGSDEVLTALLDDEDRSVLEAVTARLMHLLSGEEPDQPAADDHPDPPGEPAEDWGA